MNIGLTKDEIILITMGLQMRITYIETSTPTLRAVDVQGGCEGKINALTKEQMRLIIQSEDLLEKLFNYI